MEPWVLWSPFPQAALDPRPFRPDPRRAQAPLGECCRARTRMRARCETTTPLSVIPTLGSARGRSQRRSRRANHLNESARAEDARGAFGVRFFFAERLPFLEASSGACGEDPGGQATTVRRWPAGDHD